MGIDLAFVRPRAVSLSSQLYPRCWQMMGFQRYHKPAVGVIESDTHTGSSYEVFKFIPGVVYSIIEPQLYSAKVTGSALLLIAYL